MIDLQALKNSKIQYDKARKHFAKLKLADCVIEISEKPMSEWAIHFTETKKIMVSKRSDLADLAKSFIAIYTREDGTYFFFNDNTTRSLELLEKNEYLFFNIVLFEEFNKGQVIKELKALKNILRNV